MHDCRAVCAFVVLIIFIAVCCRLVSARGLKSTCVENDGMTPPEFGEFGMTLPEFDGEFGAELDRAIPFAYKMHKDGKVRVIRHMEGLEVLYTRIFPADILQVVPKYTRSAGIGRSGWSRLIGMDNHAKITDFPWEAPVWKGKFQDIPLEIDRKKELLLIHNKYTDEWNDSPVNFISYDCMKQLYDALSDKYLVIVVHPSGNAKGYARDEQTMRGGFDYAEMYTIQEIMDCHPSLDYNTVQFALHDMCSKFISVQGGSSRRPTAPRVPRGTRAAWACRSAW